MSSALREAERIWTTIPSKEWYKALQEVPEYELVDGRMMGYKQEVNKHLRMARCAKDMHGEYHGMTGDNKCA